MTLIKQSILILILSLIAFSFAEQELPFAKIRVYKKFLHEVIEKNTHILFQAVEKMQFGNLEIEDLDAEIVEAGIKLAPASGSFDDYEVDFSFENDQISLALTDLVFTAYGKVKFEDKSKGTKDISIKGEIREAGINISATEEIRDGIRYPNFEVGEVKVDIPSKQIKIEGGEGMEDAIKTWIQTEIKARIELLKYGVELMETQLHKYIPYTHELAGGLKIVAQMSEKINIEDRYIEMSASTEVKGSGQELEVDEKTAASFMEDPNRGESAQILIYEHAMNQFFLSLFHTESQMSLQERFAGQEIILKILTTHVLGQGYAELEKEFGKEKRVDFTCGFGQEMFKDKIKKIKPSRITLGDDSSVEVRLGLGCAVSVEDVPESNEWISFRSFYGEVSIKAKIDFGATEETRQLSYKADFKKIELSKLKIFKGDEAMSTEETSLKMMINMGLGMGKDQISEYFSVPTLTYPNLKPCSGLNVIRPLIQIDEGFLRLAVDFDIKPAEYGCDPFSDEERPQAVDDAAQAYTDSKSGKATEEEPEAPVLDDDDDL